MQSSPPQQQQQQDPKSWKKEGKTISETQSMNESKEKSQKPKREI